MTNFSSRRYGFSASTLKLLAALLMLIDHIGLQFFPSEPIFRIIGRLSFPLFAYFIAEGCRYTGNKLRHFLLIFLLGVLCESAYLLYTGELEGNILLTFSVSILLIYCLQLLKRCICQGKPVRILLSLSLLISAVITASPLCTILDLDYGFAGVTLPLFASILDYKEGYAPTFLKRYDRLPYRLCTFFIGLLFLVYTKGFSSLQVWSLLSILPLALYNGKAGTKRLKYWFYFFYPLHLLFLELIATLIS